jgi:hypothetical protein
MDCIHLVLDKLQLRDITPSVGHYAVNWHDSAGTEFTIQLKNMACNGDNIAWLQANESDEYLLVAYDNNSRFSGSLKLIMLISAAIAN